MNEEKRVRYEAISEKITQLAGGRENIVDSHIVQQDYD